jgi:hypothetical protein
LHRDDSHAVPALHEISSERPREGRLPLLARPLIATSCPGPTSSRSRDDASRTDMLTTFRVVLRFRRFIWPPTAIQGPCAHRTAMSDPPPTL